MNNPPINKLNTRNTIDNLSNNYKRNYNNMQNESNIKTSYKTSDRKGISMTPDRQIYQSNSSREVQGYNSNKKYNPSLLNTKNSSAKKSEISNLNNLNHNGNPKENKTFQKDFSQLSINNQDYSTISKLSNKSMAQAYLDRRHLETQQKINRLRHEKLNQESTELKFKPAISDNSKKIIKNLIMKEQAVKVIGNNTNFNIGYNYNYENNERSAINQINNNFDTVNANYNGHNYLSSQVNQKIEAKPPKYSQLDDYKKIAEKRENLMQIPQRNTIDVNQL